jgi:hypothetical protein
MLTNFGTPYTFKTTRLIQPKIEDQIAGFRFSFEISEINPEIDSELRDSHSI